MPNDNLFPDQPAPEVPQGPPPGNGADHTGGSQLTLEGAAELISQALGPVVGQVKEQGEALNNLANSLANNARQQTSREPQNTEPEDDFLTQFSGNPEGAINARVKAQIAEQMAGMVPLMGGLINSATSAFVGIESTEIDQQFGAGAWAKHFDKPMKQIIESYRTQNPAALSDRNTIIKEVNGLKGQLLNDLVDHRTNSQKTAAEAAEAKDKAFVDTVTGQIRTNLTGGIRRIETPGSAVTDEMKGYLAERQAAIGGTETAEEWAKQTNYGNTLADYLAHQKTLEKK